MDLGQPHFEEGLADTTPAQVSIVGGRASHISLRNTGINSLWISFDGKQWFDVAAGTSYDDNMLFTSFFVKTLNGYTKFVWLVSLGH